MKKFSIQFNFLRIDRDQSINKPLRSWVKVNLINARSRPRGAANYENWTIISVLEREPSTIRIIKRQPCDNNVIMYHVICFY